MKNGQLFSLVVVVEAEGVMGNGWLGEREANYSMERMIGRIE